MASNRHKINIDTNKRYRHRENYRLYDLFVHSLSAAFATLNNVITSYHTPIHLIVAVSIGAVATPGTGTTNNKTHTHTDTIDYVVA